MTTTSIPLQEIQQRIGEKAKADPHHRFWGLYTHVWKLNVLDEAYRLARQNNGAPGIDGETFAQSETRGLTIPAMRDRVVQGALRLVLEPIFEADFQPGSYGYRPHRTAHQALE